MATSDCSEMSAKYNYIMYQETQSSDLLHIYLICLREYTTYQSVYFKTQQLGRPTVVGNGRWDDTCTSMQ